MFLGFLKMVNGSENNINERISLLENNFQDILARLDKLERVSVQNPPQNVSKQMSIKEFLISKAPEGDVEKTLVLAYYLEKITGLMNFNTTDIETSFRNAKESVPGNVADKIQKNIARGFFMSFAEKKGSHKAYTLTNSGEKFVENELAKRATQ